MDYLETNVSVIGGTGGHGGGQQWGSKSKEKLDKVGLGFPRPPPHKELTLPTSGLGTSGATSGQVASLHFCGCCVTMLCWNSGRRWHHHGGRH